MNFNFFLQSSIESDLTVMWITIAGFLVFFMHAGFTLVEAGFTQAKNAVNIAMKNLMAISVGTIVYWFIGYSLMYGDTSNGCFFWGGLFQGEGADLIFQTMFAATAATIAGTRLFMAPEILNNETYSYPNDVWAVGCVLYEFW